MNKRSICFYRKIGKKGGRTKSPARAAASRANGINGNPPRRDWGSVDWSLKDAVIAEKLDCSRARVRVVRMKRATITGA